MDIKKLFPEKKVSKKSMVNFFDKKGFYLVLILCIALIGTTAIFVTTYKVTSSNQSWVNENIIPEEAGKLVDNSEVKAPELTATRPEAIARNDAQAVTGGNASAAQISNEKAVAVPKEMPSAAQAKTGEVDKGLKFIVPVFGDTSFEFAQDTLVFSKTMEEWRTHSGLDIAADRGTQVKAVADGIVSEVKNDPRFGVVVIIDHSVGMKSVYANLASNSMVSVNQKVKQGDVIGSVGNTAAIESSEQAHLHFEVLKNNQPVNPALYLPKR